MHPSLLDNHLILFTASACPLIRLFCNSSNSEIPFCFHPELAGSSTQ